MHAGAQHQPGNAQGHTEAHQRRRQALGPQRAMPAKKQAKTQAGQQFQHQLQHWALAKKFSANLYGSRFFASVSEAAAL